MEINVLIIIQPQILDDHINFELCNWDSLRPKGLLPYIKQESWNHLFTVYPKIEGII